MSNGRALVLCSGGLDSSCLAAHLQMEKHMKVYPLFIERGQRAVRSEEAAFSAVVSWLGTKENALRARYDLSDMSLCKKATDSGDAGFAQHPERNLVLVSLAYGFAAALNAPTVYVACNADDGGADMPDSRPDFFEQVTSALSLLNPRGRVELPFATWSKADIIKWAQGNEKLGSKFLRLTRSCWQDTPEHCGKCNACRVRKHAFKLARVDDPTVYSSIDQPCP